MSDVANLREAAELLAEVDVRRRRFNAYPNYIASGVTWLDEVPEHWRLQRLRFIAAINPTKSEISGIADDDLVSFVPMEAIAEFGGMLLDQTRRLEQVQQGYTYFRNGDIVIAKITPCFENGKGSIAEGLTNGVGFGTTELHVVRPRARELHTRYLFYLTISHPFRMLGTGEMYGAGGQKRVPDSFVKDLRTPLPPLDEQQAIARFLDHETTKLDALVAKKRRLIELLSEKRTALISHAVTKGLNPAAPTKPSGIDWLGDVPKHWDVKRLKFATDSFGPGIQMGPFGSSLTKLEYQRTEFKVYGQENTISGNFDAGSRWLTEAQFAELQKYELVPSDIVLTRKGSIGQCRLVPESISRGIADSDTIRVRVDHKQIIPEFLVTILHQANYVQDQIQSVRRGAVLGGLNTQTIANLWIAMPPRLDQSALLAFLNDLCTKDKAVVDHISDAIDRLNEYRSALVSAAVTGQIDLRREVAA